MFVCALPRSEVSHKVTGKVQSRPGQAIYSFAGVEGFKFIHPAVYHPCSQSYMFLILAGYFQRHHSIRYVHPDWNFFVWLHFILYSLSKSMHLSISRTISLILILMSKLSEPERDKFFA